MNSLEILNKFISEGKPPDYAGLEHDNTGREHTVFTWKEGTVLRLPYETGQLYIDTLIRFLEFWRV